MSATIQQIRLSKTSAIEEALSFLKKKYSLLSEAEILKIALSYLYAKEKEEYVYKLSKEEEASLAEAMDDLKNGRGFTGTLEEGLKWLKS